MSDSGAEHDAAGGAGTRGAGRYVLLVVAVVAIGLAGYAGYVAFPRFDLSAVDGVALMGLAAAAGLASFFSPCSFPLLLGLVGQHAAGTATATAPRRRPVTFGAAMALGAAAFLLLLGLGIAAGGRALFGAVIFTSTAGIALRATIGGLLVVLGLVQSGVLAGGRLSAFDRLQRPLTRAQARLRRRRPTAGFALFGFGYVLAGFG